MEKKKLLQNDDTVPAGSSVKTFIQGQTIVLPVDKTFQVIQVLQYLYLISPSLPQMHLYHQEGTDLYHAVPA